MYYINNIVVVDHHGLFIYVDLAYPDSFHDVSCLQACNMYGAWRDYFAHDNANQYFEYVLGDSGYVRTEMFILRRIQDQEMGADIAQPVVDAWNKMHAGYRIQVEWGIGGLKQKWRRLMKRFDNQCPRFSLFLEAATKLTNFLYQRRMNFEQLVPKMQEEIEEKFD